MTSDDKKLLNCTDKQLLMELDNCKIIVEALNNKNRLYHKPLIDLYDLLLDSYNMKMKIISEFDGAVSYFDYWYSIDNEEIKPSYNRRYKTKAEAQLDAVHDTKYQLKERMEAKKSQQHKC